MEAASNNRGRPRHHSREMLEALTSAWGSRAKTERQQQALYYVFKAVEALQSTGSKGGFVRGVERIVKDSRDRRDVRLGVLEQLGRLLVETDCGNKALVKYAREVNQLFVKYPDMTTREAEKIIRRVRAEIKDTNN